MQHHKNSNVMLIERWILTDAIKSHINTRDRISLLHATYQTWLVNKHLIDR